MKLAVCLLTADRSDYTADTVRSFVEHADQSDFIRLHADDGSETRSNRLIAQAGEFETVYTSLERRGPLAACRAMWACALRAGATHILHLENDWEFVSKIPLYMLTNPSVESMRLYGATKARNGARAKTGEHLMGTNVRILWRPHASAQDWECGVAHWAGPPSITRAEILGSAAINAQTFKELSMMMQRLATIRPVENIVWHIGEERTPNAKFNQ